MSQSRKQSLKEATSNTVIGGAGSFMITWVILHFVTDITLAAGLTTLACTAWSFSRGYAIRRYFNNKKEKA